MPFDAGRWPNREAIVGPMASSDRREQARPSRHKGAIELPADEVEDHYFGVGVASGALIDGDPLGVIGSHNGEVGQEDAVSGMSSTPPESTWTWKQVLALAITQLSAAALLVHVIENQLPLPLLVVEYAVIFILGFIGLVIVLCDT